MYFGDGSTQTIAWCCHTKIEVVDQHFHLAQSQYIDTGPTSPRAKLVMPGAWQDNHWSAYIEVTSMTRPREIPTEKAESKLLHPRKVCMKTDCHFDPRKAMLRLLQSDLMWQLSPGLVLLVRITLQTVSQHTASATNFHPARKCWISEVLMSKMLNLDVPCGIPVFGSQIRDGSAQCGMVGKSAHMFQKAKKNKLEKNQNDKTIKECKKKKKKKKS